MSLEEEAEKKLAEIRQQIIVLHGLRIYQHQYAGLDQIARQCGSTARDFFSPAEVQVSLHTPTYNPIYRLRVKDAQGPPSAFGVVKGYVVGIGISEQETDKITIPKELAHIKTLVCKNNKFIRIILPDLPDLTYLDISENKLFRFRPPASAEHLKYYSCSHNYLSALDLPPAWSSIEEIRCDYNELARIHIPQTYKHPCIVDCSHNPLTEINKRISRNIEIIANETALPQATLTLLKKRTKVRT